MELPEATKLPIRAENLKPPGDFSTTIIYSLPKKNGLYRRVSREGRTGLTPGAGNAIAIIPAGTRQGEDVNGLCELRRWTEGENLLRPLLPGVESPISDEPGNPMESK